MKRWAIAAFGTLMALGVPGVVSASRPTSHNQRAARSAAQQMLARLTLPPGAGRVETDRSRASLLGYPPERVATTALVDLHSFWHVPGSPSAVRTWTEAHPPTGSSRGTSGGLVTRTGARATWDGYAFGSVPGVLSSRTLLVEVARAAGGGTALRADAEVVWVVPKPRADRVPGTLRAISITSQRPGMPRSRTRTVTSADKVRGLAALIDRLPVEQPGVRACPVDLGPLVELDFRPTINGSAVAIAVADGSGCGLVTLRVRGHREPALTGGPRVIRWLQTQLGISFG